MRDEPQPGMMFSGEQEHKAKMNKYNPKKASEEAFNEIVSKHLPSNDPKENPVAEKNYQEEPNKEYLEPHAKEEVNE